MVHVTNWQLLHSVWVVWFWIMPFGVWCEQASPFIHAGFFHLIWLWNVTCKCDRKCDLGMRPGNVTWEWDLGMWLGNETWECDLGMWPGNVIWQSQRPTIPKESSESQTLLPLLRRTGNETRCTRYLGACWSICCSRGGRVLSRTWLITTSGLLPNSFRHSWTRDKCQG